MKMKRIYTIISIAAAALFLNACVKEASDKDTDGLQECMGVYFVEQQENVKAHTLDVDEDKPWLEFVVRRVNSETEESVSFAHKAYTIFKDDTYTDSSYREVAVNADDYFEFEEIYFEAGQKETTLKVYFDEIELGKTYTCTIYIDDPAYVHPYEYNSSSITFSVQMYQWKKIGKAIYRDALFSDMFLWDGRYLETEVDIYERADEAGEGYYRLDNVYSAAYMARLVEGEEAYEDDKENLEKEYGKYIDPSARLLINATDPERVYFPLQKTGFSDPSMGDILMASDVTEVWGADNNMLYGKLKDGVITFPKNGLLMSLGTYFYFSNSSGKFRLVLPDGKAEDYALELEAEEVDEEGNIAVTFTPAKDVAKIRYAMFKGRLSGNELDSKVKEVSEGTVPTEEKEISGEVTYEIRPTGDNAKTGFYTLIACTLDAEGTYREHASIELGYVNPDDEDDRSVQISFGVTVDDRYAKEEYTKENSFQYWVAGKDITHAMFNYYTLSYYNAYREQIEDELKKAGSIDNLSLKLLNKSEISGIVGNNLKPCTEYIFVVYAGNGYHSTFKTLKFKTEGKEDIMQKSFYYTDIIEGEHSASDYTSGSWIPVSMDIFDSKAEGRTIRGNWRASKVTFTEKDGQLVASGLFPSLKENPDICFDLTDGKLYTTQNELPEVWVKDSTNLVPSMRFEQKYQPKLGCISGTGYFYDNYETDEEEERFDMMTAGFVHKDIIAFTDNNTENMFWTLILGGYQMFEDGLGLANFVGDAHGDLILVREGSALLESLKKSESSNSPSEEGQTLNSINEACRVEMPAIGSIIRDTKKFEIAHEMIQFSSKEVRRNNSEEKEGTMLDLRDDIAVRSVVK